MVWIVHYSYVNMDVAAHKGKCYYHTVYVRIWRQYMLFKLHICSIYLHNINICWLYIYTHTHSFIYLCIDVWKHATTFNILTNMLSYLIVIASSSSLVYWRLLAAFTGVDCWLCNHDENQLLQLNTVQAQLSVTLLLRSGFITLCTDADNCAAAAGLQLRPDPLCSRPKVSNLLH